ncbi:hypothetical protein [Bacteroides caccae]|jgi:hypothetical protein|uniref:Uncharacterized protein n=2 Tax=Bacteroides caccae TaxID=47678 RepID=A0A5M6AIQ1_9BACE|nr:hypothetical protein [Bacteroides caccae]KAA5446292.1 hypothetical protein F2Y48_20415 [Bacteroides caccae]KAA5448343.1 hypothetical protein F2Y38_19925 [Bacteroides caccae]KAA5455911.1 hypothetical protein F2Y50_20550 [Bacteroides caccae]KAA5468096.1 hypothetical protein F2Y34_20420 [Bacteroides caccae]KAA5474786.1 hypothetical protein F2Y27_20955 [Bacteroides caccae]
MNNYNNMGGILSADILFKNEIALFAVHQNTACIKITEGHAWHPLHTLGVIEAPTVTPNETSGGTIYKYSTNIRLLKAAISLKEADNLRYKIVEGCILRCKDTNGYEYIYGTAQYPLLGSLNKIIGKKVTDYSGYELQLSGTSIYPILQYYNL